MARMARAVAPGYPHHVIQRCNRCQQTFFGDEDYHCYLQLMSQRCAKHDVAVWAYCLMPNHVHLILVPETKSGLNLAVGEAHRRYTRSVNFSQGWRGHLWQGRFLSYIMDQRYLRACTRYIERNPVRAGLVSQPDQWPWSSAKAHIQGQDDSLVEFEPLQSMIGKDRKKFLSVDANDGDVELLRKHERTGRPLGDLALIENLEHLMGRRLRPRKPGPKKDK